MILFKKKNTSLHEYTFLQKSVVCYVIVKTDTHGSLVHFDMHPDDMLLVNGASVCMSVYISHVQCMINIIHRILSKLH